MREVALQDECTPFATDCRPEVAPDSTFLGFFRLNRSSKSTSCAAPALPPPKGGIPPPEWATSAEDAAPIAACDSLSVAMRGGGPCPDMDEGLLAN